MFILCVSSHFLRSSLLQVDRPSTTAICQSFRLFNKFLVFRVLLIFCQVFQNLRVSLKILLRVPPISHAISAKFGNEFGRFPKIDIIRQRESNLLSQLTKIPSRTNGRFITPPPAATSPRNRRCSRVSGSECMQSRGERSVIRLTMRLL